MTTQDGSGAMRFTGKTAIITGGSRGIGRATAERLGREGAHVLITGRTRADLDTASAGLTDAGVENIAMVADVTDPEAPERMVSAVLERWGRLDVLVNNAGIAEAASFLEIERERWDMLLDVLVDGGLMADAYAKPVMAEIERRTMRAAKGGSAHGLGAPTG